MTSNCRYLPSEKPGAASVELPPNYIVLNLVVPNFGEFNLHVKFGRLNFGEMRTSDDVNHHT